MNLPLLSGVIDETDVGDGEELLLWKGETKVIYTNSTS